MIMAHINDMYGQVRTGKRAHLYSANNVATATS
jgi:serine/threonine-protein kinase RIO1